MHTLIQTVRCRNRILLEETELQPIGCGKYKAFLSGDDERGEHIRKILKLEAGDPIKVETSAAV